MQAIMDHILNQLKSDIQLLKNKEHWPLAMDTILKRLTSVQKPLLGRRSNADPNPVLKMSYH